MASSSLAVALTLLLVASIANECLAAPSTSSDAPAPAPKGKVSLIPILEKGGQFSTFIKLLNSTQVGSQVDNQVKNSYEGMTVFAPTDNAFNNLKAGTLNDLSPEQQVNLVLNHVLPKFYSMDSFETVSNPVRTQASYPDGDSFGVNITSMGTNQVNVSCGPVQTQINNALREDMPLAVYQIDKVLLPLVSKVHKAKAQAPSSSPVTATPAKSKGSDSKADGTVADDKNGALPRATMGFSFVFLVGLATFGFLS